jgi:hypothetical protein
MRSQFIIRFFIGAKILMISVNYLGSKFLFINFLGRIAKKKLKIYLKRNTVFLVVYDSFLFILVKFKYYQKKVKIGKKDYLPIP